MNDDWHWDDPPREEWWHKTALAVLAVGAVATVMGWVFFFVGMVQIWTR
jgi:hypothetical protein